MELWGGIECTINRVNDLYMDQLDYCGYYHRSGLIECLATSGISKLRYPVLWEKHQPHQNSEPDWSFAEKELLYLKNQGIEPIAGLVHHGSGPHFVNIQDDSFAEGLAAYATKVAEKFPWIKYYTPVNEPLTTARFCGLYGHWFPHKKDNSSFIKILVSECKATSMAMRAIREINPDASLVQTEDLGKIHSTAQLKYQADFENVRRWLSLDLLCGKVNPSHTLWKYLLSSGISSAQLEYFTEYPCPPDIIGFNYYITSERFLDERLEHYPVHTYGGNGKQQYADVEAVRVNVATLAGSGNLLKEAWERYKLPMAITEAHLNCTREEQLRWFNTIWHSALELKKAGIDIRAVTAWAMFGSFGWNKLLTSPNGDFESGIFDIRFNPPRPTALAHLIKSLSRQKSHKHPLLKNYGWWQRENRILYYPESNRKVPYKESNSCKPLLIAGDTETIRSTIAAACAQRNIHYKLLDGKDSDLTNFSAIETLIEEYQPWAIIHTAGYTKHDIHPDYIESADLIKITGLETLAVLCNKYKIKLLSFFPQQSTHSSSPRTENILHPASVHAADPPVMRDKQGIACDKVLKYCPSALLISTGLLFAPDDPENIVYEIDNTLKGKFPESYPDDYFVTITYVPDLVDASLDLMIDNARGMWHLSSGPALSLYHLAGMISEINHYDNTCTIPAIKRDAEVGLYNFSDERKLSGAHTFLPSLEDALKRYFNETLVTARMKAG